MDRRKLVKTRSLHSNLSTAFNSASMTSLKRISSVTSLSSQTSNSSSKRQIDDESNDDSESTSSRVSKKKKNSESDDDQNQPNNVRATRGNFQPTSDDTDDSLCPLTKKTNFSLSRSNGSELKKRSQEVANKSVTLPQNGSQAENSRRNFNTTRRELTLQPDSSDEEDLFNEVAPPKKQKTVETVENVVTETSQISLRESQTFKKPQVKAKLTGSSQSQANREANLRKERMKRAQQRADRENSENVTPAPTVLETFLQKCGVILSCTDEPHLLKKDSNSARNMMNEMLSSDQSKVKVIVDAWNTYIDQDANMKKALNFLDEEDKELSTIQISLVKLLLLVPLLQTDLFESLKNKITDAVLSFRTNDAQNWVSLLLQQLRFLEEIQSPASLTRHVEELLDYGPVWFHKELISYLPDILTDSQHHQIAEILAKMLKEPKNTKLTNAILNTIGNLAISKDYMESLRVNAVEKLSNFGDLSEVPAIVDFITSNVDSLDTCKKILQEICNINMECVLENAQEDCDKNQVLTLNALKSNIVHSKKMGEAAIYVITSKEKDATVFHFVIALIVMETSTTRAKQITNLLKQNIKNGYYRPTLVKNFYTKYKEIAKQFQTSALSCASELMKTNERTIVDFATDWFRKMFHSQSSKMAKQREIIESILFIMGNDNQTVKNSLALLTKMMNKPEEMKCLQSHCNYLRLLLENVDKMNLEDVATLNDLMHGLCTSSQEAHSILNEDLTILMQKQLSSPNYTYKSRGVLSAVMSIKNFANKEETVDEAIKLFERVKSAISKCSKSQCLFYDQMGQVVAQGKDLCKKFLKHITSDFMEIFSSLYYIDVPKPTEDIQARYGLNEEEMGCVKLSDGIEGAIVPILFRVLQISLQKTSSDGDLEDINALLGSPILMPNQFGDDPGTLNMKFHCINWFREIINAFVVQKHSLLQRQVISRLNDLMQLQDDLFMDLSTCDFKYQPPPCYFYQQPIPAFVKSEKKVGRKGKKSNANKTMNLTEEETWNKGSDLYAKNPSYFRRLDTKIALLLDFQMEVGPSQAGNTVTTVTVPQVCFIVNELLMIFENSATDTFVSELVSLMPKILTKLKDLIYGLRENDERVDREAVKLLLKLLTMIFSWKSFKTAKYNTLLRDALRKLAGLNNESNKVLKSCEELAKVAYRNIEAEMDVATQISLAVAFVELCQTLMSHSATFTKANKANQAKISYDYLKRDWSDDKNSGSTYRNAIIQLLKNWIDNEEDLLDHLLEIVKNLPNEVENLKKTSDCLASMPSITKSNFPLLCKKIYEGVIKAVNGFFNKKMPDPESISKWKVTVTILSTMIEVCKKNNTRQYLLLFIRYVPQVIRIFLAKGMPILDHNLKYQRDDVQNIVHLFQKCVKYMHTICSWGIEKKDTAITKLAPQEKQLSEQFLFRVKGMCVYNNSTNAFYMANLNNKNLQGQIISSQTTEHDSAETTEVEGTEFDGSEMGSEIADPEEEEEDEDIDNEEDETLEED